MSESRLPVSAILLLLCGGVLGCVSALDPRVAVLVAIGFVSLLAVLQWPWLGLLLLVPTSLLVPFSIHTGTQSALNAPFVLVPCLAAIWGLKSLLRGNSIVRLAGPLLPLLLLGAFGVVSFVTGLQPRSLLAESAPLYSQAAGLAMVLFSVAIFFLASHQIREERQLKWLVWTFVALGSLYVLACLHPWLGARIDRLFVRGSRGSLFWVWIVVLPFAQAVLNRRLNSAFRLLALAVAVGALYRGMFLAREWASGWLPPLAAVGAVLFFSFPRRTLACALILLAVSLPMMSRAVDAVMIADQSYSLMTRTEAAKAAGDIILSNPWLGLGPSNYYFYVSLKPILGWFVNFSFHNNYLDLIAQFGLVGLFLFVWFVLALVRFCYRIRSATTGGFERAFLAAGFGGLVGTCVAGVFGDWFFPFVYNVGLNGFRSSAIGWLFLGSIVSLDRFSGRQEEPQEGSTGKLVSEEELSSASAKSPLISVIIVNWNAGVELARCLQSLAQSQASPHLTWETLVVDNASSDANLVGLREQFPQVRWLENRSNVGFAAACNQGVRATSGDLLLFLNPDTELDHGALESLARFLESNPRAGAAGPRIVDARGRLQQSSFPRPSLGAEFLRLFHLDSLLGKQGYDMDQWDVSRPREVEVLQGACLAARREALELINLFDERFFVYSEEVDLCTRIREAGWRLYWVPTAQVLHIGGVSTRQASEEMFLHLYRSKIVYFRKHLGWIRTCLYKGVLLLAALARQPLALSSWLRADSDSRVLAARYRKLIKMLPHL